MMTVDPRVQAFLDLCDSYPKSVDTLDASCRAALEAMGFPYYACCWHVDPLDIPPGAIMLQNYPTLWVQHFSEQKLYRIDPVLKYAEWATRPFLWNETFARHPLTKEQKEVLADAKPFRLTGGLTVPLILPWMHGNPRASFSVVPDGRSIDQFAQLILRRMAMSLYVSATTAQALRGLDSTRVRLTPRECRGLILSARGCPEWRIGHLLDVGPNMAHAHIARRLGVHTLEQAVARGLATHQIFISDIPGPSAQ